MFPRCVPSAPRERVAVLFCEEPAKEGVRNAVSTVSDTSQGGAVKYSTARKTQPSFRPWKSHGPSKMLSKSVVALLPFTAVSTRVRRLLKL